MRLSGQYNFRKLWAKIENGLVKGKYQMQIKDNYSVIENQGKKSFVFSTTNSLGGKNDFLGYMFVALGVINLSFACLFLFVHFKRSVE